MTRAKSRTPILLVLLLLASVSAGATQLRLVAIGGAGGRTDGVAQRVMLTVGQNAIGKVVGPDPGGTVAEIGFWAIVGHPYVVSAVGDEPPVVRTRLRENYPNPFNPSTTISFDLVAPGKVRIELYDLRGHRVDTLLDAQKPAGNHSLSYRPDHLASGAYVVLMRTDSYRATQRIMLVK